MQDGCRHAAAPPDMPAWRNAQEGGQQRPIGRLIIVLVSPERAAGKMASLQGEEGACHQQPPCSSRAQGSPPPFCRRPSTVACHIQTASPRRRPLLLRVSEVARSGGALLGPCWGLAVAVRGPAHRGAEQRRARRPQVPPAERAAACATTARCSPGPLPACRRWGRPVRGEQAPPLLPAPAGHGGEWVLHAAHS